MTRRQRDWVGWSVAVCLASGCGSRNTTADASATTAGGEDVETRGVDDEDGSTDTVGADTDLSESDEETDDVTDETSTTGTVCEPVEWTLSPIKPNVVLVPDKSSAMFSNLWAETDPGLDCATNPPAAGCVRRWESFHAAVVSAVETYASRVHLGLELYPSKEAEFTFDLDQACLVAQEPDAPTSEDDGAAVLAALPEEDTAPGDPGSAGLRPARAALDVALQHLGTLDPQAPAFVILTASGAANCTPGATGSSLGEVYDEGLHDLVSGAFTDDGVRTYVAGIAIRDELSGTQTDGAPDDTNAFERLNALANDGGTPLDRGTSGELDFYDAQSGTELDQALNAIFHDLLSCTIELPELPEFPNEVHVELDGSPVPPVEDCMAESGWHFVGDETFESLELCGTYCDDPATGLKATGSVDVVFLCPADG